MYLLLVRLKVFDDKSLMILSHGGASQKLGSPWETSEDIASYLPENNSLGLGQGEDSASSALSGKRWRDKQANAHVLLAGAVSVAWSIGRLGGRGPIRGGRPHPYPRFLANGSYRSLA